MDDDLFDAAMRARYVFWAWRALCWFCGIMLATSTYAVYQTSPEVPCGSSVNVPISVQGVRVAGTAGRLVHAGQKTPSREAIAESTHAIMAMVQLWVLSFVSAARGEPPTPREKQMESEQQTRMEQRESACAPALDPNISVASWQATTAGPDIAVASWNVLKTNSAANVVAGAMQIFASADVWGGQELASEKMRARLRAAGKGWQMTSDGNAVPIMWKTAKFELVRQGEERVLTRRHVAGEGGWVGPKAAVWVTLKNRSTGGLVTIINTHLLWDMERSGRPQGGQASRLRAFDEHRDNLLALANRKAAEGIPTIITMDSNVDVGADKRVRDPRLLYVKFTAQGWTNNHLQLGEIATHADRSIDVAWSKGASPVTHSTGPRSGSDHRKLLVKYSPLVKREESRA